MAQAFTAADSTFPPLLKLQLFYLADSRKSQTVV